MAVWFAVVLAATAVFAGLPAPIDLPAGPVGVDAPSGPTPPDFVSDDSPLAPQISEISRSTLPGETLVITGDNLKDATLRLWAGGKLIDVQPLRTLGDRMQAVIPESLVDPGTMLIWPVRGEAVGRPIRLNAATAWWAWPCRAVAQRGGQTVRVFGQNLSLATAPPVVMLQGEGPPRRLELVGAHSYAVEAKLPDDLTPGAYRVWVHNTSGGSLGWSEPAGFQVVSGEAPRQHIARVDDYMAKGLDTAGAIAAAVEDLQRLGGGTMLFSARRYRISRPIVLPKDTPITLRGAGAGRWDASDSQVVGKATILETTFNIKGTSAIEVYGAGSSIRDLALIFGGKDQHTGIRLAGPDQSVTDTVVVCVAPYQISACIMSDYVGRANHQITGCSMYMFNHCVRIAPKTDFVRIVDCQMRGYFSLGRGTLVDAVVNWGGNQMILENCDVQSVDRAHGKVVVRTCLLYKSSIRDCYMANNRSTSVGSHPSVPGIERNVGEQYLFHHRNEGGGVFEVERADDRSLLLQDRAGHDPRYGLERDWIVFIARGQGAGQWRVIEDVNQARGLVVDRPWRVTPDATSVAVVQQAFRHNIVYGNTVDASPDPAQIDPRYKAVGVYLFHASFANVIANNTMKHLGVGVSISADPASPSAWNLVRDNVFADMLAGAGDAAFGPIFYSENSRGTWPKSRSGVKHWVGVGNIFRSNHGSGAPAATSVGWRRFSDQPDREFEPGHDRGLVMSVIENNTFLNVDRGLLVGAPANWTLLRNNTVGPTDEKAQAVELDRPGRIIEPMVIEPVGQTD